MTFAGIRERHVLFGLPIIISLPLAWAVPARAQEAPPEDEAETLANWDEAAATYDDILRRDETDVAPLERRVEGNRQIIERFQGLLDEARGDLDAREQALADEIRSLDEAEARGELSSVAHDRLVAEAHARDRIEREGLAEDIRFFENEIQASTERIATLEVEIQVRNERARRLGTESPERVIGAPVPVVPSEPSTEVVLAAPVPPCHRPAAEVPMTARDGGRVPAEVPQTRLYSQGPFTLEPETAPRTLPAPDRTTTTGSFSRTQPACPAPASPVWQVDPEPRLGAPKLPPRPPAPSRLPGRWASDRRDPFRPGSCYGGEARIGGPRWGTTIRWRYNY